MKQIGNGFMYYYYLCDDGRVYNAKTEKFLVPCENRYKLRTEEHTTKGISINALTKMIYGYSIIRSNIEKLDGEVFVPIAGTDKYTISNFGRVLSYTGSQVKLLKQTKNTENGYYRVRIKVNGKYCSKLVHQLVAEAFLEVPDGYTREQLQIHHKDFDKLNNASQNLEYLCPQDHIKKHLDHNKERLDNL